MQIAVLGAGMVGRAMAWDLAKDYKVTSFDKNHENLAAVKERDGTIEINQQDLGNFNSYTGWLAPYDLVITAVPGFMGYETLKAVITAGKNVADISFFSEDALQLDALAKEKNVTVITDVGVAPGMSNLILGHYNAILSVTDFECYVGGLPRIRQKPFEYKAPFSPVDVIEEYTRPARLKENGHIVTRPALSEREYLQFEELGTLEAFNTDGLRSLLFTMPHIPNLKEKTLRYPGHVELIIALQQSGFFSTEPMHIKENKVVPLDVTSEILFNNWKLRPNEEELTIMKVIIKGEREGKPETIMYTLLDRFDVASGISSMSRTTGYTCTAAANLIAKNLFTEKGVFPPELVGSNEQCFEFVLNYLAQRNVIWVKER